MNEINYLVTVEDIAHLNHYHQRHSKRWNRARRTAMGLGFGMLFLSAALFALMGTGGMGIFLMWGLILLIPLAIQKMRKSPSKSFINQMRRIFSDGRNMTLFGNHQIKLLEDHLEVGTDYSNSKIKWEAVENVVEDEHYIFIYISSLTAHVINKKYFHTQDAADAFFRLAQRLHQQGVYQLEGQQAPLALPAPQYQQKHMPMLPSANQPVAAPQRLAKPSPQGIDGSV